MEPSLVLAAVDRMRLVDDELSPDAQTDRMAVERESLAASVDAQLAGMPEVRAQLAAALHAARLFNAGRERTKSTIVRLINEFRLAFREIGRRAVDAGIIESPTSIAMLTLEELGEFV